MVNPEVRMPTESKRPASRQGNPLEREELMNRLTREVDDGAIGGWSFSGTALIVGVASVCIPS